MSQIRSLDEIIIESHETALQHGFWDYPYTLEDGSRSPLTIPTKLFLIIGELIEAGDNYHKRTKQLYDKEGNPVTWEQLFTEELADTCIRLFDLAGDMRIDLYKAIIDKMVYNKTRPRKHGKAF